MHPRNAVGFDWDEENEEHLARHGVTPEEVEQVFLGQRAFARNKTNRRGEWMMIGWTTGGRALSIIVNVRDKTATLRVITGYDAPPPDVARHLSNYRRSR